MQSLPERVRASCAHVVAHASHVTIDDAALTRFTAELAPLALTPPLWSAGSFHYDADAAAGGPLTAQYVFVLDALNWCFWPSTTGAEYDALAGGLRDALAADARAFDADALARATAATVARWTRAPHALPFLEERAARVREVGAVLGARFGGLAANVVRAARGSAARLAELVAEHFVGFRDEAVFVDRDGAPRQVFFYKRAQILAGDVWTAYGRAVARDGDADAPLGAFSDAGALTAFADYRLPQILRERGVLVYAPALAADVDAQRELPAGLAAEVEIRAATVVAVERLAAALDTKAVFLDHVLWWAGEEANAKGALAPHHRVRTCFY